METNESIPPLAGEGAETDGGNADDAQSLLFQRYAPLLLQAGEDLIAPLYTAGNTATHP